jgi:acyl-CoA reductase-like NAD-dependent aldehyde dehydrogenase
VSRLDVRKTYKLFIGGAFPRSESGRSDPVADAAGAHWANASRASRKDVREAVAAAAGALPGWSGRTAYNRGQVIYRVAEVLEGRSAQFAEAVARAEGVKPAAAAARVAKAVDRLVWYAGWADKLGQVFGTVNQVAGPFANWSVPEPTGVVGLVAPPDSALLGLVSRLAPVMAGGNTAVVLAPEAAPLPAIDLAEVLATSDVPGGVVNVLTGRTAELLPPLAAHRGVHGLDLAGVRDAELRREAELAAADSVKRVAGPLELAPAGWLDDAAAQDPWWIAAFMETKTTWHPAGR